MDQKNMENNEKKWQLHEKIILHHQTNLGYPATTKWINEKSLLLSNTGIF